MGISLDLKKAHLSRLHGDMCAVYTWINEERAMVLLPWRRPGAPWYVIMEPVAYKYNDPHHLAKQCKKACDVLGIEPSKPNWTRVATIINDGLPDLITMPESPPVTYSKAAYGHMEITADGKTVAAEHVRVPVQEGATYG